jgi:hypothetical protein
MATAAHVLKLDANYSNDPNGNMSALICRATGWLRLKDVRSVANSPWLRIARPSSSSAFNDGPHAARRTRTGTDLYDGVPLSLS